MMPGRPLAVASAGVLAAAVVLMSSIDWFAAGAGRQRSETTARLVPKPARALTEPVFGRSRTGESRRLAPEMEASSRTPASELRKAGFATVASAAESAGPQADSVLADAALGYADAAVREEAIRALGERGSSLAVQTLQQTIQDPDSRIQHATVRALTDVGTQEAVWILGVVLGAQDASLRLDAVEALGDIGSPDAALYIQQGLRDESPPVREAAAQWLAELSDKRR
jgi:HEAT repeat protein